MAVQKSKKSRSKRDTRRSHDKLTSSTLSIDKESGELHQRHHITETGYYKGVKVIDLEKNDSSEEDE